MEARLHAARERSTARRENETLQQNQHRLETQQQRQAAARAVENDQHRMARLQLEQQSMTRQRANETPHQQQARLQQDRFRHQRRLQVLRNLFRAAVSGTPNAVIPTQPHNLLCYALLCFASTAHSAFCRMHYAFCIATVSHPERIASDSKKFSRYHLRNCLGAF